MIYGRTWKEQKAHRERWKRRFAFVPIQLDTGLRVWLEWYWTRVYWVGNVTLFGHWQRERVVHLPEKSA